MGMQKIPSGYVGLRDAVTRMVEQDAPDVAARWRSVEREWRILEDRERNLRRPEPIPTGTSRYTPLPAHLRPRPFTAEEVARLAELRSLGAKYGTAMSAAHERLAGALADGALQASAVTSGGILAAMPIEIWRSAYATDVLYRAEVGLCLTEPGAFVFKDPAFLSEDSLALVVLPQAALLVWLRPPARRSQPARPPRSRVCDWMLTRADTAKRSGQLITRDQAIRECQAEIRASRDDAREAWNSLPADLKRRRGRTPAKLGFPE